MLIRTISTAVLFAVVLGHAEPTLAQIRLRGLRNFENYLEQEAYRHLQSNEPKDQGTTFSASKLQKLRKKAAKVTEVPKDTPEGWSKSKVDPAKLVEVFAPLKVKKGVVQSRPPCEGRNRCHRHSCSLFAFSTDSIVG